MKNVSWSLVVLAISAASLAASAADKGESAAALKLKARASRPKPADVDASVSLDALLAKTAEADWSTAKAGAVEGAVVQVEREHDGDTHIVLAPPGGETDTKKWVIVEVTPGWQARSAALSTAKLRDLVGKKVKATGWLYYEPDAADNDPRGTRWELHPVTEIAVLP